MLRDFYPEKYVDSSYQIPYQKLYAKGIRGIIFDIDNTLVPHGAPADSRALQLFEELKRLGMNTCLLSNNQEPRVASFAAEVGSQYIFKAGKPGVKNYWKAMKKMGTDQSSTVFIGDQLFTDIYGANKAGIYSILVKPIHPKEEIQIVLKRRLETIVLNFYQKEMKKQKDKEHKDGEWGGRQLW